MPRLGLTARLALGSCAVAGLAGLLVGLPLYDAARTLLEESLRGRAEAVAETIAVALGEEDPNSRDTPLEVRLRHLADESGLDSLTLDDADGAVVASADPSVRVGAPDPLLAEAGVSLRELATKDAETTPVREDATGHAAVLAVTPVEGSDPPRFVAVRAPASWTASLETLRARVAGAVVAWMVVAGGLGAMVTRRALRPLERLRTAAQALTMGQADADLPRSGMHELDALADEFDRMRRAIAGRERWLRALAGTVAHEVRNPANALRLHLGLLGRSLAEDAPASARVARLVTELDELDATVSSLLAFAEGAPACRAPTPLGALLRHAAAGAAVEAADASVDLDGVLVGRAVANLVRNARQAGANSVRVFGRVEAPWVTIRVEDDGRGFPPEIVAKALEPFARGEHGGTGLGLALVVAVARAHDGDARIVSPGPGSTCLEMRLRA